MPQSPSAIVPNVDRTNLDRRAHSHRADCPWGCAARHLMPRDIDSDENAPPPTKTSLRCDRQKRRNASQRSVELGWLLRNDLGDRGPIPAEIPLSPAVGGPLFDEFGEMPQPPLHNGRADTGSPPSYIVPHLGPPVPRTCCERFVGTR